VYCSDVNVNEGPSYKTVTLLLLCDYVNIVINSIELFDCLSKTVRLQLSVTEFMLFGVTVRRAYVDIVINSIELLGLCFEDRMIAVECQFML